jgi:predicted N-acetyltransferase YhbS
VSDSARWLEAADGQRFRITWLSAHRDLVPTLARWHVDAFHHAVPNWNLGMAAAELASHQLHALPCTFVALDERDAPLGSVSLLLEDPPGDARHAPWLASLYVDAPRRGQGIGLALLERASVEAHALGHAWLHLWTTDQAAFYERHGWEREGVLRTPAGPAMLMKRRTHPSAATP